MGKFFIFLFFITPIFGVGQSVKHNVQAETGFNRVGFYNDLGYKIGLNNHQLSIGVRYYTFDNFFEKNTVGLSLSYCYQIASKNDNIYFYPGISFNYFKEKKTTTVVSLIDFKLINGLGCRIYKGLSIYYQLGFGLIDLKSKLFEFEETVKINYFNYEMAIGLNYRFGNASK